MSTASGRTQGRSKRQRSFALPDGREVHIALSPDEAARLRQRLKTIKDDGTFDVVIQSSPEHINYLKLAHSHHEERRRDLRTRHGEAYDEFERVKQELDALSVDLHMLSDHAVSLDANFSKFGYDAHLRTYDDPTESGAASLQGHDEDDHEHRDWDAERHKGRVFKLYKRPVVRQYFHRGLLWRASATTEVATFELFLDLLYVGIIAINGDRAAEDPTGYELQRYAITFIMSWRIWSDITVVIAWFEVDDILQRVSVLFIMACLIGLTTNMLQAFEQTYTQLVAFYLAARLFNAFYYVWIAYIIPMVRAMMIAQMLAILLPSVLWIASIFIEMPQRLVMIWVSLMLDLFATSVVIFLVRGSSRVSSRLAAWSDRVFEFYPAVNIEHKTERINAFVTLIFGYSVVALLYQNSASFGLNAFFGKAVLGLIQAFCLNTIYFEIDGSNLFQHAIRRHVITCKLLHDNREERSLTVHSATLDLSPSTFPVGLLISGRRPIEAGIGPRLLRCRCGESDRVLYGEVLGGSRRRSSLVLLRWT
jgi:low temperature requirement protein LtrA